MDVFVNNLVHANVDKNKKYVKIIISCGQNVSISSLCYYFGCHCRHHWAESIA